MKPVIHMRLLISCLILFVFIFGIIGVLFISGYLEEIAESLYKFDLWYDKQLNKLKSCLK